MWNKDRIRFTLLRGGHRLVVPPVFAQQSWVPSDVERRDVLDWLNENMHGRWRYAPQRHDLRKRLAYSWAVFKLQRAKHQMHSLPQNPIHGDLIAAFRNFGSASLTGDACFVFQHQADLVMFKLRWSEEIAAARRTAEFGRFVIPTIRRVMPRLIAQSLTGVAPMTAPSNLIQTLRARYETPPPPKPPWWKFWLRWKWNRDAR